MVAQLDRKPGKFKENLVDCKNHHFPKILKMPKFAKALGIGAKVGVAIKNLHPKEEVKLLFLNASTTDRLEDCIVVGETTEAHKGKEVRFLVLRHENFGQKTFNVKFGACKLHEAGNPEDYFQCEEAAAAPGTFIFLFLFDIPANVCSL